VTGAPATAPTTTAGLVRAALDEAIAEAERRHPGSVSVLDAGCGRVSALKAYRPRIDRFVGADIHAPTPGALPHLDEFATVDLCADGDAFPPGSFDVSLSSFTLEHFADPPAAVANIARWLRPGGRAVFTTVNRRHPFVAAYLAMPAGLRQRVQPLVKATAADAHPIVGACNTPAEVRDALVAAGLGSVEIQTVSYLETAWKRRAWTRLLGRIGDRLTADRPSRRSTIVAVGVAPANGVAGGAPEPTVLASAG
jgi:SAM-dependent methyltransferase